MKRLVKWLLSTFPRPLLQRLASYGVPLLGLFYLGRGRECPICGARRRRFLPYGYVTQRDNALCPSCLSLERHRLLWLFLEREMGFDSTTGLLPRLLHIAPEVAIMNRLEPIYELLNQGDRYLTADIESPLAKLHFDVQAIPLDDDTVDVIICNHLLEHVASDAKALEEFHRILRKDGWAILMVPQELDRAVTFEDDTITDEVERTRIFGQYDHRRVYGADYADRLRAVGFKVEAIDYYSRLSASERELYALNNEIIYLVRP